MTTSNLASIFRHLYVQVKLIKQIPKTGILCSFALTGVAQEVGHCPAKQKLLLSVGAHAWVVCSFPVRVCTGGS